VKKRGVCVNWRGFKSHHPHENNRTADVRYNLVSAVFLCFIAKLSTFDIFKFDCEIIKFECENSILRFHYATNYATKKRRDYPALGLCKIRTPLTITRKYKFTRIVVVKHECVAVGSARAGYFTSAGGKVFSGAYITV